MRLLHTLPMLAMFACACSADAAPIDPLLDAGLQARRQVELSKPNQQAALRYLAYSALAQYQALRLAKDASPAAQSLALQTATQQVAQGLLGSAPASDALSPHGMAAAATVLALAKADRYDSALAPALPSGPGLWVSQRSPAAPPHLPALGQMRTTFLSRGDAVRPPPPPTLDSAQFQRDLAEVRRLSANRTADTLAMAKRWEMTGGSLVAGFWHEQTLTEAQRHGDDALRAARVLATVMLATMDANIACHDAKYTYWFPRPSQVDPGIPLAIGLPNHPSYPSNHACDSGAAAYLISHFYPDTRAKMEQLATEATESRYHAGLHYRFDGDAGLGIAREVARITIERGDAWLDR